MKKLLLLLATVGMIFTACEGGEGVEEDNGGTPSTPKIELAQQSIEAEFEPAEYEVGVTSPYSWEATSKNDWIIVDTPNGIAGTKMLKFSVVRNEEEDIREGTIVVKNDDYNLVAELYITQKAFVPAITIEPELLKFTIEGGTQEIAITANFEYEFSTNVDWLTIEKSEKGLKVTASNHTEVENRTAEIIISKEKYGVSKVVNVTQNAFVPDEIIIDPESLTFTFEGGTQEVAITINFEYEYSTNVDWLTVEKSDKGVNITATPNANFEERTAEITISSEKYGISKTIAVTQKGVSAESQRVIIYTSSNGRVVTPYKSDVFGANIVSNTYGNGQGLIIFDAPITSIGDNAFRNCTSLTSVTIPNSITSIGEYAFRNCTSLTSITIPDSVTSIGEGAFYDCRSLTSVTIPNSVTSIGKYAFRDCTSLTSVTIGNSVTSIGEGAFYYCRSLTSVTIPNSITSIGNSAFYKCTSLTSVIIPNSVTLIGSQAFWDCTSLTSVTIPDGVTSIGVWTFGYCTSLTSITIGNSVTSIGEDAFRDCTSLTSVVIPDSVTSIGEGAFNGCTSLTSVTIGNSVTSIGNSAFYECTSLTSVTIGNSVTSIGSFAFSGCTSLTSVTIPDSVTSIGYGAFEGCTSLTSVAIPDSVTSIGYAAFSGCTSLKEVYCKPTTPPTASGSMFYNNASERKIYVPRNSVIAYKAKQYWRDYASYIEGYDF